MHIIIEHYYCNFEGGKYELGIAGFGVAISTMEEVFLRVKQESDEDIDTR